MNDLQKSVTDFRALPELVTVKQVAEMMQVSRGTVYNLINSGDLRAKRVRNVVRLNRDEVLAYCEM